MASKDFGNTAFIFSHYNRVKNEPQIFTIKCKETVKGDYPTDADLISTNEVSHLPVVSDGQDTFADRLIFGSLYRNMTKVKLHIVQYLFKTMKPKKSKKDQILKDVTNFDFLKEIMVEDLHSIKFRELSLQEAVDFCALLIKIVMDIQIYTEKIPTVGGLIKIATIDKEHGFQWVAGEKIASPKIIL